MMATATRLALWLGILATTGFSFVPGTQASEPLTDDYLQSALSVDPQIRTGRLENGLRFYIRTNTKPENRAELWLAVDTGSMQEDDDQQGLAHFVEHMAFNGTKHFEKQELIDYLEGIGMKFGPDINAFTSFDETVYMLTVPTDDEQILAQAFQILEDWAHGVSFEGEEIDKERGVVVEEWRLGRGAEARIRDQQFPVLFKDSRYAQRLPIGKKEILETAPHEALRRFYRDWYRPDLMAVIAVGDFDPLVIEARIREHFASLKNPETERTRELYPVPEHEETLYTITTDPEATRTTVGVYYKLDKRQQTRVMDYRRQLAEQIYHAMFNARLNELRQQADPPFLFAFSASAGFVRTRDVYLQAAGVKAEEVNSGLQALLTEVKRVDRHGFTPGELERSKLELLRRYEQAYAERDKRQSSSHAGEYLRNFLEDEPIPGIETELELVRQLLPTLSLGEINRLADEWITESNRVVMVSGPEKPDLQLATQDQLASSFAAVDELEVMAYVDRIKDLPLIEETPETAEITATREIVEIGVTEWQLANGALVVMKPTDFKNDQILMTGFSPGGHSLVSDPQHTSASFATSILGEGGLGAFDQIELEKALAGKLVSVGPYIGELEEGVDGSASPQDMETLFQLLYLTFTAPRLDQEAVQSFMTRMRTFVENRHARPESVFADEIALARYQGHWRRRPPSLDLLDEIDAATATKIYSDRFADAGDFTFVVVGNFDLDAIKPLVQRYMGALPAIDRDETWRDVEADPVAGRLQVKVERGLEPKSQVRLIWSGPAVWSREHLHDITSLAAALRIRLREILREDLGAVYGVGVNGSVISKPKERFTFSIGFGCSPEKAAELIEVVRQEIMALRTEGLEESYAAKVREMQHRQREIDLKENGFWLRALKGYYSLEMDPRLILDYDALVSRVTSENLEETAQRYLDPEQFFEAVLYPEGWKPASE